MRQRTAADPAQDLGGRANHRGGKFGIMDGHRTSTTMVKVYSKVLY
jgi:hypothetical protein